jgi:hypothetical protein
MRWIRSIAMWLVFHVPMGRAAPHVFHFALGSKGYRVVTIDPSPNSSATRDAVERALNNHGRS